MDISNWANSGSFTLSNQLNLKATKSIAQSRAETKLTYRSKTSKIDRRKYKSQALKQKLEYDGKMSQISRKSEKNKMKLRYPGRSIFRPVLKKWTRYIDVKFCAESSGELRFSIRQSSTTPPLGGTFWKNRFWHNSHFPNFSTEKFDFLTKIFNFF